MIHEHWFWGADDYPSDICCLCGKNKGVLKK